MANEELVNRLRERAKTLWQWAVRAERNTGPSAATWEWRTDGDLHDDAATEIYRLARELEATRAALRIAQTTAANLHDTIRLRDRELEEAREGCPVCGHEWRRHDPADGRCDAASEDPLRDGAVCPCGRDLAWMQARIAELSRRALAKDTEVSDGE